MNIIESSRLLDFVEDLGSCYLYMRNGQVVQ